VQGPCIPKSTKDLLDKVNVEERHPGLQLDKFSTVGDQQAQKKTLEDVCKARIDSTLFESLIKYRKKYIENLPTKMRRMWSCKTAGPLTLHLSRISALENAGICLHPLYGFVYLPGSGLKGMARAYAETIWKPANPNKTEKITNVFGNEPGEKSQERQHAGNIIFHDAWPEELPKLIVDIVNCHHSAYYGAETDDDKHAPGDWENPVPVYFLAVPSGVTFSFALSKRRPDVDDELLNLAKEWLIGALCYMGAGAKTNAGYGAFKPVERIETAEFTLELVTPAFLAGASQNKEDCDLRPATLRGLLRWWWRTMHAGFVEVKTLRAMEAAVWGDTNTGGAVRITVERHGDISSKLYDKRELMKEQLEKPPDKKTTQGLFYLSYGMGEESKQGRKQRYYILPGAKWKVRFTARASRYCADSKDANNLEKREQGKEISADTILNQAKSALWLLCHFGGVGSKARKGFGSFADIGEMGLDECKKYAREFREICGVAEHQENDAASPTLGKMLGPVEIQTEWKDYWFALDQLGFSVQRFAQRYKHRLEKKALGLPRNIKSPEGSFNLTERCKEILKEQNARYASPVHYHLAKGNTGNLTIRIVAFPAECLPDIETSRKFLQELLKHLQEDLKKRAENNEHKGQKKDSMSNVKTPVKQIELPNAGESVEATLLEEKTKKGRWKAKHNETNLSGPIQNSDKVPSDKKAGDRVRLIVAYCNEREIAFEWPT